MALINFIIFALVNKDESINHRGDTSNIWYLSFELYTNILLSISFSLLITVRYITMPLIMSILVTTFGFYIIFICIIDQNYYFKSFAAASHALTNIKFYLSLICVSGFTFIVGCTIYAYVFLFSESICYQLKVKNHNKELVKKNKCESSHISSKHLNILNNKKFSEQSQNIFYDSKIQLNLNQYSNQRNILSINNKSKSGKSCVISTLMAQNFLDKKPKQIILTGRKTFN